jgi:TRAP transporter TAXI family solute receptor
VASLKDLATSAPTTIVAIPAEVVAALGAPYLPAVIPAGTYEGQAADVPTASVGNFFVTHEGVSEETVYQMTKLLFENLPALEASHKAAAAIKLENALNGMPIPLHPGAERYYREIGLIKG